MVVEELLQLLVDKVDGDLLESIVLKDFESSDVQHSAEVGLRKGLGTSIFINLSNNKLTYVVYQCVVAFDDPGGIKDIELAICK